MCVNTSRMETRLNRVVVEGDSYNYFGEVWKIERLRMESMPDELIMERVI